MLTAPERWVSIAGGVHLAIGNRSECQDVPGLGGANGIWAQRGVTLVNAVPTLINIMTSLDDDCRLPPLIRLLNLGGEACPPALVKHLWSPSLRIVNTYGPSETTVTATFKELVPDQTVTIGKPLPGYHALVLPVLDEVPTAWTPLKIEEGMEGELAIGGHCLGKGYIGRPALTQEKFIQHPMPSYSGERLYRTGDRVRLDHNLDIVFLGRIDAQVKHRGFRIELGEIEQVITAHSEVQTAAVILSSATSRLEAYIVVRDSGALEVKDVRHVLRHLPAYMMPEAFFFLPAEQLPRLPSGKINVRALQDKSSQQASIHRNRGQKEKSLVSFLLSTMILTSGFCSRQYLKFFNSPTISQPPLIFSTISVAIVCSLRDSFLNFAMKAQQGLTSSVLAYRTFTSTGHQSRSWQV